jgi:hypothetical protein
VSRLIFFCERQLLYLPASYLEPMLGSLAGQSDQEQDQPPVPGLSKLRVFCLHTHGTRIRFPELEVNSSHRIFGSQRVINTESG